jgi:hypothetical protein
MGTNRAGGGVGTAGPLSRLEAAVDVNATSPPSREMEGAVLAPLATVPSGAADTRTVRPVSRSRRKTSLDPLSSPSTIVELVET